MPPRVPAELSLEPPDYEEDIATLSPYASLPLSTSSKASSSTLNSSTTASGYSPRSIINEDEYVVEIPYSGRRSPAAVSTPKNLSFNTNLPSPSSPALPKLLPKPQRLSRSQNLPRMSHTQTETKPRQIKTELGALTVESTTVARMRRWILGIAVVEFDLDSGPVVDGIFPPLTLHKAETETIAFCAFPDSLQFDQGTQTHSFCVREQRNTESSNTRPPTVDGYIYGFAYFIQRRDAASKRGYQQRSLIILTHLQYPSLFSSLAMSFGPLFEAHGTPMLEAACHNIATWPDPTPGDSLELGFLGSVLQVELPHSQDAQQLTETSSFNAKYNPISHILATTAPFMPPPILLFEEAMSNLWSIWECLVLCEPILVFGTSPAQTSQAIWWFRDLLRPIPLAGDVRPYFTMQDSDSTQLVNKLPPKAGLLLGVTNPFFEKSCVHWPHVLSLGRKAPTNVGQRSPSLGASAGPAPGWKTKTHKRYISKDRNILKQIELAIRGNYSAQMDASLALRRHFCSRSTQLITPLARYLNTLIPTPNEVHRARRDTYKNYGTLNSASSMTSLASASPALSGTSSTSTFPSPNPSMTSIPSAPASSSFTSLPSSGFLSASSIESPLSASASGVTPTQGPIRGQIGGSTNTPVLRLKPFNNANFFASLKTHGSALPFKSSSKRVEFYERWLKSPAFGAWLAQQEQIVQTVLNDPPAGSDIPSPRIP